jgi:hypothetical protein
MSTKLWRRESGDRGQQTIPHTNWSFTLDCHRRVDIITDVSLLASAMALPSQGHLEVVFHVFAFLKQWQNARLVFDPTYPDIDHSKFRDHDWKSTFGDVQESIPLNMPTPRGKEVDLRAFVDLLTLTTEGTKGIEDLVLFNLSQLCSCFFAL